MTELTTGELKGNVITLVSALPRLDGRRVRVAVEPIDESEVELGAQAQTSLWSEWAARGPQGPIDDESEPEFP